MTKLAVLASLTSMLACGGGGSGDDVPGPDAAVSPDGALDPDGGTAPDAPGPGPDASGARDPGLPGTYRALVTASVSIPVASGTIAGTVCAPSTDGATPAPGPFPLVVISPGYQLARAQYQIYCEHLATWGYVVVTRDYAGSGNHQAKAAEVGRVIDWATGAASGLAARIDAARVGVAGHSLGGKVSINAAILDPRVKAVVGWDPVDALPPFGNDGSTSVTPELMGNLRVPLAVLGETTDASGGLGGMSCAPAADNYTQFYNAACNAPTALEVTIGMADHMDWIGDRASCGLACFACSNGQTPEATVHTITFRVTTAWFERHLRDDASVASYLAAPAIGTPTTLRSGGPSCAQ
ncbi:MAG: alpha/beta hydrolase [Myxococcales bacterium]|nr:alpha/beta hydrolase [Myxococcales bacterium]